MPLAQHNDAVQAFFSHAALPAFRIGVEIGRPRRQLDDPAPTRFGKSLERLAELAIAVVEDKSGQAILLNREIGQLLNHPVGVRMSYRAAVSTVSGRSRRGRI